MSLRTETASASTQHATDPASATAALLTSKFSSFCKERAGAPQQGRQHQQQPQHHASPPQDRQSSPEKHRFEPPREKDRQEGLHPEEAVEQSCLQQRQPPLEPPPAVAATTALRSLETGFIDNENGRALATAVMATVRRRSLSSSPPPPPRPRSKRLSRGMFSLENSPADEEYRRHSSSVGATGRYRGPSGRPATPLLRVDGESVGLVWGSPRTAVDVWRERGGSEGAVELGRQGERGRQRKPQQRRRPRRICGAAVVYTAAQYAVEDLVSVGQVLGLAPRVLVPSWGVPR